MKPPRRPEWSVEDHALFAARRDFELLRLVVSDKKIWYRIVSYLLVYHAWAADPDSAAQGHPTLPQPQCTGG